MGTANGRLILAENGGGNISVVTVNGAKVSVAAIKTILQQEIPSWEFKRPNQGA
jgi:hypothetical protein